MVLAVLPWFLHLANRELGPLPPWVAAVVGAGELRASWSGGDDSWSLAWISIRTHCLGSKEQTRTSLVGDTQMAAVSPFSGLAANSLKQGMKEMTVEELAGRT